MATIEQRLHRQRLQEQKDKEVCSDYKALLKEYPQFGITALCDTLAEKYRKGQMTLKGVNFPTSGIGVRDILVRHGLYSKTNRKSTNTAR